MLIRISESDLDRWKSKVSFKSVITKLLHGDLRSFRNWIWKHLFPHSWKRLEARIHEQMKQLYNNVDGFLAYGDAIQRTYQPSDFVFGSPNDKLEFVPAPISEQPCFDPAKIESAYMTEAQVQMNKELIEFYKQQISAQVGIPKDKLFNGNELSLEWNTPNLSPPMILHPRGHGRATVYDRMKEFENMWNQNIPQTEEQEGDYLDSIKQALSLIEMKEGLDDWQKEYMQNPAPVVRIATPRERENPLRGETIWSGTVRAYHMGFRRNIEIRNKQLIKTQRGIHFRDALRGYLMNKARKVKKERICFNKECGEPLDFYSFIDTNTPKSFIGYYKLRELWNSEYIQLYCCHCFEAKEREVVK